MPSYRSLSGGRRDGGARPATPPPRRASPMAARRGSCRTRGRALTHGAYTPPAFTGEELLSLDGTYEHDVGIAADHILERHRRRRHGERIVNVAAAGKGDELGEEAAAADRDQRLLPSVEEHRWAVGRFGRAPDAVEGRRHGVDDGASSGRIPGEPAKELGDAAKVGDAVHPERHRRDAGRR